LIQFLDHFLDTNYGLKMILLSNSGNGKNKIKPTQKAEHHSLFFLRITDLTDALKAISNELLVIKMVF
jgi:hypothetical protein